MVLITAGRLADAASFVVGIHILTRLLAEGNLPPSSVQEAITWAAVGLAGVLALGSTLGYIGSKLAARFVVDYESACLVEGIAVIRHHQESGLELSGIEASNITKKAPQMMSRSMLYVINACTAFVLTIIGLLVCVKIFPVLTIVVLLTLILMSPLYVFAAVHSTNIGHSIRINAPAHGQTLRRIQHKWLSEAKFDQGRLNEEVQSGIACNAYREAYRARLALPARNNLLSSLTLAFVVAISFVWIANEVELRGSAIAIVVSYLVALRLFAHGLSGIFHSIQSINTSFPLFLTFLIRDPRFAKVV
jgi:hypothetical protein